MSEEEKISSETAEEVSDTSAQPVADETPAPADEATEVSANGEAVASPYKGFFGKVDNYFGITKSKSNYKAEIIAGLTTFMAMVYILIVNPGFFSQIPGMTFGANYIATAIGAIVGTMLMAFLAKMPLAQASGMGVNAVIVYNIVLGGTGLSFANAMVFTLLDGVIFVILTATGLRQYIFKAIPDEVRKAINVGLGLFIAYIGFQNAGFIVNDSATLTDIVSFNVIENLENFCVYKGGTVSGMLPALVMVIGVIAIAILSKKKVKGAILWGILGSTALFYIIAGFGCIGTSADFALNLTATYNNGQACHAIFKGITFDNPFLAFKDWGELSVGQVFVKGFDFSGYTGEVGGLVVLFITTALSLCMLDMFDTIGTLYGACEKGGLLDKDGTPLNMNRCMLSDAIATCTGAIAGTSTVTTFVESSAGVAAGGKTGFTALVTGLCFIVAMFLSPIARVIPSAATATALVWVGVLMMSSVTNIDWTDPAVALPAFLTIGVMAFGYEISYGIGIGMISSLIIKVCTGKIKEVSVVTWIITLFFLATFLLTHVNG